MEVQTFFFGHMRFRLLGSIFGRLGQFSDVGFFFLGCSVFIAEMRSEIFIPSHPLIAFKHLGLYIQKHLRQSVAAFGSL